MTDMNLEQVKQVVYELCETAMNKGLRVPDMVGIQECRGKTAGWCKTNPITGAFELKFNVRLLNENPSEWFDTIVHELAHAIAQYTYGQRIKPHGREWKHVCHLLGGTGNTRHTMSVTGHAARRTRVYKYDVNENEVELGAVRHKRLQSGKMTYRHKYAGTIKAHMYTGKSRLKS